MRLRFENKIGKIEIGGGDHPIWNMTSISGIGYPNKEFNTARYGRMSGQRTLSSSYLARTITVAGDIKRDIGEFEIAKAIRILDSPGTLYVYGRMKKKKISGYCSAFEYGEKNGSHTPFTLQFVCDDPFFEDIKETTVDVFRTEDMIKGTFSFPKVFTRRYSEADIMISGDCESLPIFRIYNTPKSIATLAATQGIEIRNETTGQFIGLDCETVSGEVITIDIASREITSSVRGDIIADMTDDTFLDRFWLQKGTNHISVTNYNTSEEINVVCAYNNRYMEAIS